ncbi:MAG TPA: VWA domain-containing protein [Povalibacter sp.]|nr:VWA domain-containing protein [Povalibacter sp.]
MMTDDEATRRWRLILGGNEADGTGMSLTAADVHLDNALQALYDSDRRGGLGSSAPNVARWLGDIREYFPASVVQVMQRDAIERLDMTRLLMEPEMLESLQPDVHLVADLIALSGSIPAKTRDTARAVVRKVVEALMAKLSEPTRQAVNGAINRAARNRRPKHNDIDWPRTIRANLRHYQPEYQTIVPEVRIGFGRRRQSMRHIVLCIDQSGSMAASVVYSAIFGAVLATLPAVTTSLVVFDTAVVDLTEELDDPIDLLFSTRLGGGTDINRAVAYCQQLVRAPHETIFVLISDLYEGGVEAEFMKRAASMVASGIQFVTLLALSDEGSPSYNAQLAAQLATLGVPAFACTPDRFPELMAAAIQRADLRDFAATTTSGRK